MIDGYDREYLSMLGFKVMSRFGRLASADANDDNKSLDRRDVVFFRWCCKRGSLLSRLVSGECVTIRDITE